MARKTYSHVDASGMRWRMDGSRPVSELADKVMADVARKHKGRPGPRRPATSIIPTVGMGATMTVGPGYGLGSDRYPFTVTKVMTPNMCEVQADTYRRTDSNGMSESQVYVFSQNPKGRRYTIRRSRLPKLKNRVFRDRDGALFIMDLREAWFNPSL